MKTDIRRLKRFLRTRRSLREIAKMLGVTHQTVEYHRRRLGYPPLVPTLQGRPVPVRHGAAHHSWTGGRFTSKRDGYVMVMAPASGRANKYVAEHILVVEKRVRRRLHRSERVHHINGDHSDNGLDNLHLCSTAAVHRRLHYELEKLGYDLLRRGVIVFDSGHYRLA